MQKKAQMIEQKKQIQETLRDHNGRGQVAFLSVKIPIGSGMTAMRRDGKGGRKEIHTLQTGEQQ